MPDPNIELSRSTSAPVAHAASRASQPADRALSDAKIGEQYEQLLSKLARAERELEKGGPSGRNEHLEEASGIVFDLLYALASKAGEIQSRESLYLQRYKREYDGLDRTLDVRISHLRKKLGDAASATKIRTVWGHGYLFVADAW